MLQKNPVEEGQWPVSLMENFCTKIFITATFQCAVPAACYYFQSSTFTTYTCRMKKVMRDILDIISNTQQPSFHILTLSRHTFLPCFLRSAMKQEAIVLRAVKICICSDRIKSSSNVKMLYCRINVGSFPFVFWIFIFKYLYHHFPYYLFIVNSRVRWRLPNNMSTS